MDTRKRAKINELTVNDLIIATRWYYGCCHDINQFNAHNYECYTEPVVAVVQDIHNGYIIAVPKEPLGIPVIRGSVPVTEITVLAGCISFPRDGTVSLRQELQDEREHDLARREKMIHEAYDLLPEARRPVGFNR